MTDSELQRAALAELRARHGSGDALTARAPVRVARLDRPQGYVLVAIDDARGLHGIVALGEDATVESSAVIRDPSSIFLTGAAAARAAAEKALPARRGWGTPFLAWRPCKESFDSMRPLWVVPHTGGEAYVTQNLTVSETLSVGRGG